MKWPWQTRQRTDPFRAELPEVPTAQGRLDPYSETWAFIRTYCLQRMTEMRVANDNPNLDEKRTSVIRGEIKALKEIMDLPKPKPEFRPYEEGHQDDY